MFTVCVKFESDGREHIFSAATIEMASGNGLQITLTSGGIVEFASRGGVKYATAWVMNENGKTVGTYSLYSIEGFKPPENT